jgi:hypothetical protein
MSTNDIAFNLQDVDFIVPPIEISNMNKFALAPNGHVNLNANTVYKFKYTPKNNDTIEGVNKLQLNFPIGGEFILLSDHQLKDWDKTKLSNHIYESDERLRGYSNKGIFVYDTTNNGEIVLNDIPPNVIFYFYSTKLPEVDHKMYPNIAFTNVVNDIKSKLSINAKIVSILDYWCTKSIKTIMSVNVDRSDPFKVDSSSFTDYLTHLYTNITIITKELDAISKIYDNITKREKVLSNEVAMQEGIVELSEDFASLVDKLSNKPEEYEGKLADLDYLRVKKKIINNLCISYETCPLLDNYVRDTKTKLNRMIKVYSVLKSLDTLDNTHINFRYPTFTSNVDIQSLIHRSDNKVISMPGFESDITSMIKNCFNTYDTVTYTKK